MSEQGKATYLLTEAEAAEYVSLSPQWLRKSRHYRPKNESRNGPPYVRLGRKSIRYRTQDLDLWIEQSLVQCRKADR